MNADTPSSASEMTWKATSSRLCRIISHARTSALPASIARALPSRRRSARGRTVRRGAGWRPRRTGAWPRGRWRRQTPRRTARRRESPVSPATTVSSAPPRPSATTGRPHACASSGTMPKSSSPGRSDDRGAAIQVADLLVASGGRGTATFAGSRGARARRARGRRPTIFSGTPARRAGVDGEVDALVGHQRRHDERETLGRDAVRVKESRCRRADTPRSPRDYSIGRSCPQHNER